MAERKFTDLELERSLAGDLSPGRAAELERDASDADRARLGELRAANETFLRETDVAAEVAAIQRRVARLTPEPKPRMAWLRWMVPAGALAAAAAVALIVMRPGRPSPVDDDDLRTKGDGVTFAIHLRTGTTSRKLDPADTVPGGATIRFEVHAPRAGYVAVVGVDAQSAMVYYPIDGNGVQSYEPGGTGVLAGAIRLDDVVGDERFYAVFADQPFSTDAVMAALRAHGDLPRHVSVSNEILLHKISR